MKLKKLITYIIILGIIIGIGMYARYIWLLNKDYEVPAQELIIEPGLGVKQISAELLATGYIHNDFWFRTYIWQKDLEDKILAGRYYLPEELSMKELVEILTTNQATIETQRITLIEGWRILDMAEYLHEKLGIDTDEWFEVVGYPLDHKKNTNGITDSADFSSKYDFLSDKPEGHGLEGYLFPDTYELAHDAAVFEIVTKQLNNFDVKLSNQMRADIAEQGSTIFEILTIASILERELLTLEEKKLGASVIANRLAIGMPLQMDSTVNYVTGKSLAAVTFEDLEVDSPYNTYMYRGLPPGPISNPGLDSLVAAIYPTESDYLYFLTDREGVAHFSTTLAEHNANKQRYLR